MGNVKKPVTEITKSNGSESEVKDDSSRSGNDTNANGADIKHIYDEEPMAEVQLTAELMTLNNDYFIASVSHEKAHILELKRRHFEDYCSDNQYAISIKEDTAYLCLHSPKTT
ncbi:hypothetical protein Tco_1402011 [Tanacetum coccineum]